MTVTAVGAAGAVSAAAGFAATTIATSAIGIANSAASTELPKERSARCSMVPPNDRKLTRIDAPQSRSRRLIRAVKSLKPLKRSYAARGLQEATRTRDEKKTLPFGRCTHY